MKKRQTLPAILLTLALLLSLCGTQAFALDDAPAEALPDEPYEAVPYRLFPIPEGGYVGDTMPFVTKDGVLELYYLFDTDRNGQGYHPFYKYSTRNFYEYKDHGMVLNFGQMSEPDPALGTGSVFQDKKGTYHLFYTGHNDLGNGGMGKECVMHATSTDREHWVKMPGVVLFAPDNYSKDDFRDPEVFWVEEEQCYWMLISAHENTMGGVVAQYISKDLINWEFCGAFYPPHSQYMLECPDLFCIGDTWYLTYSWDCVTYYAMSKSMYGPFYAPSDNILDGKSTMEGSGFIYYAAKTAQINGDLFLCGWHGRAGLSADSGIYQWGGNILNHQLVQKEDKTLGVKAPESLRNYFTVENPFRAVGLEGEVDMGTRPATMTLECDVILDDKGCVGFAFGGSEADETYTALCLDADRKLLHYEGYEITELDDYEPMAFTRFDFSKSDVHHVKLVCENEIVVLYIDDSKALSSRITHSIDGAHIGVFADGCGATFSNISIKLPG